MPTVSKAISKRAGGPLYVDTSALLKLYFRESDSNAANELLRGRRDVVIAQLAITEMISAIARRCREGALDFKMASVAQQVILDHLETGIYACLDLLPETHREAERILFTTREIPLRTADALHLALARSARARSLLTFDRRMAEAGRTAGFVTFPL